MRLAPAIAILAALATATSAQRPTAIADEETLRHFQAIVRINSTDPPGSENPSSAT